MKTEKNTANIATKISLFDSVLPIFFLILLLFLNVYIFYGDSALEGSNQFILLTGAFLAILVVVKNKININSIFNSISKNIESIGTPILILLLVGSLAGSWLLSGIIPSMIYYPIPIHKQEAYKSFSSGRLEKSEITSRQVLSLPMCPETSPDQIEYISNNIIDFFNA